MECRRLDLVLYFIRGQDQESLRARILALF